MNWKDQFNAVRSNVFDFAERVKTELTAENELDPSTELQVFLALVVISFSILLVPQGSGYQV